MSKRIRLGGKHAVGDHEYTIVDDDMFDELNRYAWKAKPNANGTHVYAIRTQQIGDKTVDIRMHRVVLGYDGPLDVDHFNRNSLDNRRANLRAVTRSVNTKNTGQHTLAATCLKATGTLSASALRSAETSRCWRQRRKAEADVRGSFDEGSGSGNANPVFALVAGPSIC